MKLFVCKPECKHTLVAWEKYQFGRPMFVSNGNKEGAHRGATTMTLCPRLANAMGKLPTTSPSPPVLLQGATSEDTKTVSRGLSVCASSGSAFFTVFFTCNQVCHMQQPTGMLCTSSEMVLLACNTVQQYKQVSITCSSAGTYCYAAWFAGHGRHCVSMLVA